MDQLELLRKVPALSEVPEAQLEWIIKQGACAEFEKGDYLFSKGDPIDKLIIVIKGKFTIKIEQNGEFKTIADIEEGEISGALPYSRATSATGYAIAQQPSSIISLDKKHFRAMIKEHHELTTALVHTMTTRVREFTKTQHQQEKLMSLGKLSAGLAHELNNPASAMVRSSNELEKHLKSLPDRYSEMMAAEITKDQLSSINIFMAELQSSQSESKLSLSESSELEDEIADWLEEHGLEDGYAFAPIFVERGMNLEAVEHLAAEINEGDLPVVLYWIHDTLISASLVREINNAAARISELVSSIKSYTHMDRGTDLEPIDVSDGIHNTLKMLGHKLREKQIKTEIGFPEEIPKINGRTGSLNQVWTNIIDNAIDAMPQDGVLKIFTEQDADRLMISIQDNGPGIPEDIQSKIFDPFFTTKKIGEGTGMGLDIVSRIIRNHNGEIRLHSEAGHTKFTLCFPLID